jgi:hypothetical protein
MSELSTCVVCSHQFEAKQKAGEISIRLVAKGGHSLAIAGPVCRDCAAKSGCSPDAALSQMRAARARLLAVEIEVRS